MKMTITILSNRLDKYTFEVLEHTGSSFILWDNGHTYKFNSESNMITKLSTSQCVKTRGIVK